VKNFRQPGDTITLIAPTGGATVDVGYIIGQIFAVATGGGVVPGLDTVPAGEEFEGKVTGVIGLAKTAPQVWAEGDSIWWDDTAKEATNAAADMRIGVAVAAALSAAVLADVRLDGIGAVPAIVTADLADGSVTFAKAAVFVSTEQTGTGAPQNIAHGLGAIPAAVLVTPTDLAPATTGDYTVTEGAHDATDVIVTVTTSKKYKVMAWA
jgi:predicted RecA/RadA family phage recombinase